MIKKSTTEEKKAYQGMYPLYGYVTLREWDSDDRHIAAVEDLRGDWSRPDPVFEIIAPQGYGFEDNDLHSLLCFDLKDVSERSKERLWKHDEKCLAGCAN